MTWRGICCICSGLLLAQTGAKPSAVACPLPVEADIRSRRWNAGFDVVDLGVDLSVESLMDKLQEIKPQILGLSALVTTTMPEMENVLTTLVEKGMRDDLKVMVGGAPVDREFAARIGADAYGGDAAEAVQIARDFVSVK